MMMYLLLALCGLASGVTTVLFGFGGGFVAVPVLFRLLRADPATAAHAMHVAVATSTCVMIVGAALATRRHARAGRLTPGYLWPLAGFVGVGALAGAMAASHAAPALLRLAFIVYLAVTIADCLLRRGFLTLGDAAPPRRLRLGETAVGGVAVGAIAAFLGVGGSVMTVPLLRRCRLPMAQATALANPLTLPVAVAGTAGFVATAGAAPALGPGFVGYVDLGAFAVLTAAAIVGMRLAAPWIGRLPDRLHAQVYLGLLGLVLVAMAVG